MKAVIAIVIALVLLAIGIALSQHISDSEQHTITRTVEPLTPAQQQRQAAATHPRRPPTARAARDTEAPVSASNAP